MTREVSAMGMLLEIKVGCRAAAGIGGVGSTSRHRQSPCPPQADTAGLCVEDDAINVLPMQALFERRPDLHWLVASRHGALCARHSGSRRLVS
ncbi:hypothetical protein AQPW35_39910 [Rubrivivax pictus]|uniref:Uncharacterized protein n=1 Tax=Pseudaquabacterium pictum TaxID=2315236 RepID=A0A480AVH1_9BURK|nr:hypothetical protein AQPW35_39910 [Rubrivivax pictus]